LVSIEARELLLERINTDTIFFKSLKMPDEGDEEDQDDDDDNDNGGVNCDEIDSSKTVDEAIADIIDCTPADCLADIYADEEVEASSESDAEDRGAGINLDMWVEHPFSDCNATRRWMEWNGK
jgi:hypothetical protein